MRSKSALFMAVAAGLLSSTAQSQAACTGSGSAWSCPAGSSAADIANAMANGTAPGTITLAAGPYSFSATVIITKAWTIQGTNTPDLSPASHGATSCNPATTTCISSQLPFPGDGNSVFEIAPSLDTAIRITAIGFILNSGTPYNNGQEAIHISNPNLNMPLTKVRVDHNTTWGGGNCFWVSGWIEGVADHNRLENCYSSVLLDELDADNGTNSYNRMYATYGSGGVAAAGTQHAFFLENNKIVHTTTDPRYSASDVDIYVGGGGVVVDRWNDYDATLLSPSIWWSPLGAHGNYLNYCAADGVSGYNGGSTCRRAMPIEEHYNNTFELNSAEVISPRGGSVIFHDNTITTPNSLGIVKLAEEEVWNPNSQGFNPVRTSWPAQDQVINSFFWNNTVNGAAMTSSQVFNAPDPGQGSLFTENRDYYLHAPQSSGGKCYYVGRPGSSGSDPTPNDSGVVDGGEKCTTSGANAYYPYSTYCYPHPLVSGQACASAAVARIPAKPTSLALK